MNLTQSIQEAVKIQAVKYGFNLTTADGYNKAFAEARRANPALFESPSQKSADKKSPSPTVASVNEENDPSRLIGIGPENLTQISPNFF